MRVPGSLPLLPPELITPTKPNPCPTIETLCGTDGCQARLDTGTFASASAKRATSCCSVQSIMVPFALKPGGDNGGITALGGAYDIPTPPVAPTITTVYVRGLVESLEPP